MQLDRWKLEPIDVIKKGFRDGAGQPGPALLGLFLSGLIGQVGLILCCIGVFSTWPIGWMTNVHIYKQLRASRSLPEQFPSGDNRPLPELRVSELPTGSAGHPQSAFQVLPSTPAPPGPPLRRPPLTPTPPLTRPSDTA